jgi:hypothetical protein
MLRATICIAMFLYVQSFALASDALLLPKGSKYEVEAAWAVEGGITINFEIEEYKYVEERRYLDGEKLSYWVLEDSERNVLAVMRVPKHRPGYEHSYGYCKIDGSFEIRRNIIAIVNFRGGEEWSRDIERAWRVNTKESRFEQISVNSISCRSIGYGL